MIQIVWEFIVKPEAQGKFELVFGPGGAWGKVFDKAQGFRGTTMLNDTVNLRRYLIFDIWDSDILRQQALKAYADEYATLSADLAAWTESRVEVGVFRMRAEATVRPRGKSGGRKTSQG
ncbi:MAG: hypothetical protein IAE80_00170 [Anaerolinea sp.]|nr:hypothetical protein [Anaerolinea sp.]